MYRVRWEIDVDAATPDAAAQQALAIQRNNDSIAAVFDVTDDSGRHVRLDAKQHPAHMTTDQGYDYYCTCCGTREVHRGAEARWNVETQAWELFALYDRITCEECGSRTHLKEVPYVKPDR